MYQLYYAKARVQQVLVSLDGLIDQIAQGGDDVEMAVTFPQGAGRERGLTKDRVGPQIDKLFCQRLSSIRVSGASAKFDPQVAAFCPAQLTESTSKSRELRLPSRRYCSLRSIS
jgi:hypothetical protein